MLQRPKILIAEPDDFSPEVIGKLRKFADVELKHIDSREVKAALDHYDVFWFRLAHKINSEVLSAGSRCKILATPVTGIDHIDEELCRELGVRIVCLRGEKEFLREVRATAEMTIGLAIGLMRNIPQAAAHVQNGYWDRDRFRGNELYKKTAGIIGFGRLGAIVAEYFNALGMKVIAYDIRNDLSAAYVEFANRPEEVVQQADVVSLHVNYTPSTHHLVDEALFTHFKADAVLINTSRGGIVDESALLKALQQGRIKGAALDVLQGEPETSENPLVDYARHHNNLLIVPHIGGNTYESFEKTEHFIADKVLEKLVGVNT